MDTRLLFSLATENLGTRLNCTMHFNSFNQNQPCTALVASFPGLLSELFCTASNERAKAWERGYCTGTATPVESVHNHCCSPSVHLSRSRTWSARLTLVSEASGSLAKLQPIHEHLWLRSGCSRGCRMSENKRWEVVQQTFSFCVRYIWCRYLTTETQYQTLCVS